VVQGSKKVLQFAEDHTIDEGLDQVALWNCKWCSPLDTLYLSKVSLTRYSAAFLQSPDLIEAGMAFMTRRTPEFKSKL
jgi:hypothetical protein